MSKKDDVVSFTMCSETPITIKDAEWVQSKNYPPSRYGLFNFSCRKEKYYYTAHWNCYSSEVIDTVKMLH